MKLGLAILLVIVSILSGCTTSVQKGTGGDSHRPIDVNLAHQNQSLSVTTGAGDVVSINQDVYIDPNNSSNANLNAGATFTGTRTDTTGVGLIQVSMKSDVNCSVFIEQSPDGTNWDITDTFTYTATFLGVANGNSWDARAENSWYRVRVTNSNGTASTFFRLQSALLPSGDPLPRALTKEGRLKTDTFISDHYGNDVEVTLDSEMRTISPVKLVGTTFQGSTLDTSFWTSNTSNNGTVTQSNGVALIQTNTTANGAAYLSSVRRGRYIAGSSMRYRATVLLTAGATNNTRQWGVADYTTLPTITDGHFFQLTGTTLQTVCLNAGTPNTVSSGSFNGVYGSTYTLDANYHVFEIYWNNSTVQFSIDDQILEEMTITNTPMSSTQTFYIWSSSVNSGGITSNNVIKELVASIDRMGQLQTATIYKHITTATTTVCKLGAGNLHSIMVNTPTNSTVTVYDNTTNSGTVIAIIALGNNTVPYALPFNADFYTGLTVVTSGSPDLTIVYE